MAIFGLVINWLEFLAASITLGVVFSNGQPVGNSYSKITKPYPDEVWVAYGIGVFLLFIFNIIATTLVDKKDFKTAGIFSVFLCGVLGGIFILLENPTPARAVQTYQQNEVANKYPEIKVGQIYELLHDTFKADQVIAKGTKVKILLVTKNEIIGVFHDQDGYSRQVRLFPEDITHQNDKPINTNKKSVFDQLREYKALVDEGVITQEEFEDKKKELLSK